MNWKVGDKFWVDYSKCRHAPVSDWQIWFPPNEAPFTIRDFNGDSVVCSRQYQVFIKAIYNKNKQVLDIIKDL